MNRLMKKSEQRVQDRGQEQEKQKVALQNDLDLKVKKKSPICRKFSASDAKLARGP
jgi:hypothetical protein